MRKEINVNTSEGSKLISDLRVHELKLELEKRGLSKYGNKKELLKRLLSVLEADQNSTPEPAAGIPNLTLENEADLNNDFIRDYFKSQKALFEQVDWNKNISERGVESVTANAPAQLISQPQSSTSKKPSKNDANKSNSTQSETSCTRSRAKRGVDPSIISKNTGTIANDERSILTLSHSHSEHVPAIVIKNIPEKEDVKSVLPPDPSLPVVRRGRGRPRKFPKPLPPPLSAAVVPSPREAALPQVKIFEKANVSNLSKIPSIKIKLPEAPSLSPSPSLDYKNDLNFKLKYSGTAPESPRSLIIAKSTPKICLSPQNAEVSSSVQEEASLPVKDETIFADSTSNSCSETMGSSDGSDSESVDENVMDTPTIPNNTPSHIDIPIHKISIKDGRAHINKASSQLLNSQDSLPLTAEDSKLSTKFKMSPPYIFAQKNDLSRTGTGSSNIVDKKKTFNKLPMCSIPKASLNAALQKPWPPRNVTVPPSPRSKRARGLRLSSYRKLQHERSILALNTKNVINLQSKPKGKGDQFNTSAAKSNFGKNASNVASTRGNKKVGCSNKPNACDRSGILKGPMKQGFKQPGSSLTVESPSQQVDKQPDFFESLKQQIEMPLYVEKCLYDKSEVSSTTELMEPKKKLCVMDTPSVFASLDGAQKIIGGGTKGRG